MIRSVISLIILSIVVISVIKVDGTYKTEVAEALVSEHCGYCEPAWSLDGKKIMYYAPDPDNDNKPSIFVIELEIAR